MINKYVHIIVILWFRVCNITVWYNLIQTVFTRNFYLGKNIAFDLNVENIVSNIGTIIIMVTTFCSASITDSKPCSLAFFTLCYFFFFYFYFLLFIFFCFLNCHFVITWDFGHPNWFVSRYQRYPEIYLVRKDKIQSNTKCKYIKDFVVCFELYQKLFSCETL